MHIDNGRLPSLSRPKVQLRTGGTAQRGATLFFVGEKPMEESLTICMNEISEDGTSYKFEAIGSKSGYTGTGSEKSDFSLKGRQIKSMTFDTEMLHSIIYSNDKGNHTFKISFKIELMGKDIWKPGAILDFNKEERTSIIHGFENKEHTLEIIPNENGILPLQSVIVYEPQLKY